MNDQRLQRLRQIVPNVSRETFDDLCAYENLVRKWQSHINLISNATLADLWERHILDSAQLLPLHNQAANWLDLGSGGGFPGIVIAIFLKDRRSGHIDLVESNGKKAAFLRTVSAALSLPATIHHRRIENCQHILRTPDVITARALTHINGLFDLIAPLLGPTTVTLMQKGRDYLRELDEAGANWQFDLVKHISMVDQDSVILEIRHLRSASQRFGERQGK